MSLVKTQAIKINEATYPIAMACLPPAFATIPLYKVLDHWLVINEIIAQYPKKQGPATTSIGNHWLNDYDFSETYSLMSDPDKNTGFSDVLRVAY